VRLCVLGPLVAVRDAEPVAGRELGSRRGRHLLAMLLVERGGLVPTDRLADLLWPARPPADPVGGVATLASRLRAVLGEDVIAGGRSAYGLVRGGRWTTDLDAAAALADEATARLAAAEPGLAAAAASRVLADLGGHLGLDDIGDLGESGGTGEDAWLRPLREEVRLLRRRATHLAVAAGLQTGAPGSVRDLAARAVTADLLDEQAARDLMTVLLASGEQAQALRVYADLARALRSELGADPARETRDLHLALLRGEPVGRPAPSSPATPAARPLLGRAAEVDAVRHAWTDAVAGHPSLVVVTGPGGIGKSRLLAEVTGLASGTGGLVLAARCHAAERSLFLQPVADALRPALVALPPPELDDLLGAEDEAWRLLLPELAGPRPDPAPMAHLPAELERRRAYETVRRVLTRLARGRPVLLALDDAQDAGVATLDLLDHLTRHLGAAPVLLVAAARQAEADPSLLATGERRRRVDLGALPDSAVHAMAAAAGQDAHAAAIVERTRGHAFSVVEMLRALAAGERGVPTTVREAVLQRVTRSGQDAATVLQAASVLGPRVDPHLLAGLLDRSDLDVVGSCEALVAPALFARTDTGYEFANDLVQEVVYAELAPALRLAYHRRAADLLAGVPEAMAVHAAALGDDARAARGWLRAGQQALDRAATGDAVVLLTRALAAAEASGATDLRVRVLIGRASALEALTRYADGLVDLDLAVALAEATGDRRLEMSALSARGGDVPVALHHPAESWGGYVRRGLALATELGDRRVAAELGSRLAVLAVSALRFDEAEGYAQRAVRAGRTSGDERALAAGLDGLKTVWAYLGDGPELADVLRELLPLLRRSGDTWVYSWCLFEQSFVAMSRGDAGTARAEVEDAVAMNARSGFPAYASFFRAHRAWFARLAGDLGTALVEGRLALADAAEVGHPWWFAASSGLLAATLLETGATEEAGAIAGRGLDAVAGHGAEGYQLLTLGPLAQATGDPAVLDRARSMLAAIRTPPGQAWVLGADAYLTTARAVAAAGDAAGAADLVVPLAAATSAERWPAVHEAVAALGGRLRAGR
jgi:DNA-binding SARP family transcriptional activator/tetratricopeptide (TPR) repeat protein